MQRVTVVSRWRGLAGVLGIGLMGAVGVAGGCTPEGQDHVKKAHDQGRLYEGLKTISWCPTCASALAKHECEYKTVEEESIFVKLKVEAKQDTYLVIWTTTPWTSPT